jgi:dolichyl-phosphate-mannose-protein mannosyltransferase
VALSMVFYLATWIGWFITNDGYFRHYRADNGLSEPPVLGALLTCGITTRRRTTSTAD